MGSSAEILTLFRFIHIQDLGVLGNSRVSGDLSAIPTEFVFAKDTLSIFSAIPDPG